jgi:hypothetical protein
VRRYLHRLRIWETDYGRVPGWLVERDGHPIAQLTEPRFEEMFWDSYRLEILTDDAELRCRMLTSEFWNHAESERLVWRSREFGEQAPNAFPSGDPFPEPGRLMIRGLYLSIGAPTLFDRAVLWLRRQCRVSSTNQLTQPPNTAR